VISEDVTTITHQIMPPYLESVDNSSQLKIVGRIIDLMRSKCSWSIGNDSAFLHKDTAETRA
jgi:hypothetical protein